MVFCILCGCGRESRDAVAVGSIDRSQSHDSLNRHEPSSTVRPFLFQLNNLESGSNPSQIEIRGLSEGRFSGDFSTPNLAEIKELEVSGEIESALKSYEELATSAVNFVEASVAHANIGILRQRLEKYESAVDSWIVYIDQYGITEAQVLSAFSSLDRLVSDHVQERLSEVQELYTRVYHDFGGEGLSRDSRFPRLHRRLFIIGEEKDPPHE